MGIDFTTAVISPDHVRLAFSIPLIFYRWGGIFDLEKELL